MIHMMIAHGFLRWKARAAKAIAVRGSWQWVLGMLLSCAVWGQPLILEGGLLQTFELAPGQQARGVLRLRNAGEAPLRVTLSVADYREQGGFIPLGEAPYSLGVQGVQLELSELLIPAQGLREIGFTVQAPAGLSGTRYAAILLTPEVAPRSLGVEGEGTQIALQLVQRYAVLVLVSYGGVPQVLFRNVRFDEPGSLVIEAENRGERYYYPQAQYQIFGAGGVVAQGELGRFVFLPGEPKQILVPLGELAPGEYQLVALFDDVQQPYAVRGRFSVR